MNITIFSERLRMCRKKKYSSQQAFADAYMKKYGTIRSTKKRSLDHNMFGTIQSWEQGKSMPTADVLANICDLLDCDSDYLLGRIPERKHDINDMHRYTGLSSTAIEQLHSYCEELSKKHDWMNDRSLDYLTHNYYHSFSLFLIDELLCGSKSHKLSAFSLNGIFEKMIDGGFYCATTPSESDDDFTIEEQEQFIQEDKLYLDSAIYSITSNIRDILMENCMNDVFPPTFSISENGAYCPSTVEGSCPPSELFHE